MNSWGGSPVLELNAPAGGRAQLTLQAEIGKEYLLESSVNLVDWELLGWLTLLEENQLWTDAESADHPFRFYRARPAPFHPGSFAPNFRLIDHTDRSRELFYHSNQRALVLIFTRADCPVFSEQIDSIRLLRDHFSPLGVQFWVIYSGPETDRIALKSKAQSLELDLPLFQDESEIVTRALGVNTVPEAIVLNPSGHWQIFYRGQIAGRASEDSGTGDAYLEKALSDFLEERPIAIRRTAARGCSLEAPPVEEISYTEEIAPLLKNYCVRCHSPGNIAPWSMSDYSAVRRYAPAIKAELLAKRMPPWPADPHYGEFANDFSLPPEKAARIIEWIDQGSPRGEGPDPLADLEVPLDYPFNWPAELGEPDEIITLPVQEIPAHGHIPYRYINVPTQFGEDVWVRAAVVLPGNAEVLHHTLVYFRGASLLMGLEGFFSGYVPGFEPAVAPEGTGKRIPNGAVFQFQMHYTPTGQPETDQTRLGLYFHDAPPERELKTRSAFDVFFTIPPGVSEHQTAASYHFPQAVWLHELAPHMHYRGSWFRYEALYPDGTREVLLSVPRYDFDWQLLYRFAEPKYLPANTTLICVGAWDNSARNPKNPDPEATVRFGEQSDDEMFVGYFNYSEAD